MYTKSQAQMFQTQQRLAPARLWFQTYAGEKVSRGYRRFFGMDWPTAFKELELFGVSIPADYQEKVLETVARLAVAKQQKKAEHLALENPDQKMRTLSLLRAIQGVELHTGLPGMSGKA
jgi:hypothetical protein